MYHDDYLESLTAIDKPYFQLREESVSEANQNLNQFIVNYFSDKSTSNKEEAIFVFADKNDIAISAIYAKDAQANTSMIYNKAPNTPKIIKLKDNPTWEAIQDAELNKYINNSNIKIYRTINKSSISTADKELLDNGFTKHKGSDRSAWLYAEGQLSKAFGKNWGSDVMTSVGNALGQQKQLSWK
jgi:hypothetical protein